MKPLAILAALVLASLVFVGSAAPRDFAGTVQPFSTAVLSVAPAVASAASHEPMTPNGFASSRERPAEPGDDGLGVRSGSSASTPAQDASSVTWEGTLAFALPSYGPRYLAIRQPRGTRVTVCGPAACLTRISTDFGPSPEMARQGRIADVSAADFERLCGMDAAQRVAIGLCPGYLTLSAPLLRVSPTCRRQEHERTCH